MRSSIAVVTDVFEYAGPPAAEALADQGMTVLAHSPRFADAAARKEFEVSREGYTAAEAQTPEDVVAEAMMRFGRIDAVISNDAADIRRGPAEQRSADDYRALLEDFTVRPFRLARAAIPVMKTQGAGRIVLITSGAPLRPSPEMAIYSAARAATNTLVKSLATELGPSGISINAVAPFYLESSYFPKGMEDPVLAARIRAVVPMGRFGKPSEIGPLIALLAAGQSAFVSGQVIAFSGGGA